MGISQTVLPGDKSELWWEHRPLGDAGLKPSFKYKHNVRFYIFKHAPECFCHGTGALKIDAGNSEASLDYRLTICVFGDDADSGCLMSEMLFEDKNVVNSCGKVLVKLSGFPLYNVKNIKCKHTNKADIRD